MQDADRLADVPGFTPTRRPRRWLRVLGALLLALTVLSLAASLTFLGLLDEAREGLNVTVNGQNWRIYGPPGWEFGVGSIVAGAVAILVVLVVVPLTLLMTLLCVVLAVGLALLAAAVGVALALGAALLGVVLATSPLWGLVLLLWWLLRPARRAPAPLAAP